jgi:hypothetical protein
MIAVGSVFALTVQKYSRSIPLSSRSLGSSNSLQMQTNTRTVFSAQPNASSGQRAPSNMEVEVISITRNGFEPSEIRRPAELFLLAVNNQGRPTELSFEICRLNGQKLHEMKGGKGQQRQRKILDLPPGQYVLKELNHPEWSCAIVLSAK